MRDSEKSVSGEGDLVDRLKLILAEMDKEGEVLAAAYVSCAVDVLEGPRDKTQPK